MGVQEGERQQGPREQAAAELFARRMQYLTSTGRVGHENLAAEASHLESALQIIAAWEAEGLSPIGIGLRMKIATSGYGTRDWKRALKEWGFARGEVEKESFPDLLDAAVAGYTLRNAYVHRPPIWGWDNSPGHDDARGTSK